jgi:hypothetical protein
VVINEKTERLDHFSFPQDWGDYDYFLRRTRKQSKGHTQTAAETGPLPTRQQPRQSQFGWDSEGGASCMALLDALHPEQRRAQLAEVHRKQTAQRKSLHGRKVNEILAQGDVIKLEKLSYRTIQKRYGKSVGFRGPGTFVNHLRCKAGNAGAEIDEFPTTSTWLSQVCVCGAIEKKPLSQRWHTCGCGVGPIQCDLFSAWPCM